ncbi:MAG TPA: hypothetical protein VGA68_09725 [Woeseiaceae bacterium]|jgi:hypothetical protein
MKLSMPTLLTIAGLSLLAACDGHNDGTDARVKTVQTTGKEATALEHVPAEVLAAARAARPDLDVAEAEHEVRDGRDYYDVGGLLPDGSEMELDMTQVDGAWTVVEFQREIGIDALPAAVAESLATAQPGWLPERIIESEQADGFVIYEFFGKAGDGQSQKIEVKWDDPVAEVLQDEWVH